MATNKKKLLITRSMSPSGRALLKERGDIETVESPNTISAPDFQTLLNKHAPVNGVALGATRFGHKELDAAREMLVVARIGVGFDAVDVPALTAKKVPLMVAGSANSPSVAEQAMFMMMMLAKRGAELHAMVKDNQWNKRLEAVPFDLYGKTVLIVGFGRIGTSSAKRCQAMEMNVLIYDPYVPAATIKAAGCEPVADLDAALPRADFVTIHCPKTPETVGMFNAARLARMKPTAYLVNTARGGIIDEPALHARAHGQEARRRRPRRVRRGAHARRQPAAEAGQRDLGPAHGRRHPRVARPHGPADREEHHQRARRRSHPRERHQQGGAGLRGGGRCASPRSSFRRRPEPSTTGRTRTRRGPTMPIINRVADLQDEITGWRHDLHANPEILYEVHRTAGVVVDKLKAFGCDEVVPGIGRTGVVGVIKGRKAASGKVIGLRADMDALPMTEATGLPYASQDAGPHARLRP